VVVVVVVVSVVAVTVASSRRGRAAVVTRAQLGDDRWHRIITTDAMKINRVFAAESSQAPDQDT